MKLPILLLACLAALCGCSSEASSFHWQRPALEAGPGYTASGEPLDAQQEKQSDATGDGSWLEVGTDATDAKAPFVTITAPSDGAKVPNPVTFEFQAGGGVETVWFEAEDSYPLQNDPLPASQGNFTYKFSGVNTERHIVVKGRNAAAQTLATDEVTFTPGSCILEDQPGFNHYTIAAINNGIEFPKNGTNPYCWEAQGNTCGGNWGMVHDGIYTDGFLVAFWET